MSHPHRTALLWLRRDLRLADNPALIHALKEAQHIIPVFIHAPEEEAPWTPGAASNVWLHHSLRALNQQLEQLGSRLIIRRGQSLAVLRELLAATGATLVCWNRVYEPALIARDTHIKNELKQMGIHASSHSAALLFEPWAVQNRAGKPFKVFTPFWQHCVTQLPHQPLPQAAPDKLPAATDRLDSLVVDELQLLPRLRWDIPMMSHWQPGETGAHQCLQRFIDKAADGYATARDRPDLPGTSRLSPYLHFGEIGPRQVVAQLQAAGMQADAFVRELGWREFAYHLLYHFPHTTNQSLDTRFDNFAWQQDAALLNAWQRGLTGIPLVDAGMRELWQTGYMHNRVRMIVASFLTKNLRLDWLAGARWFWDTLVDADLASNTLGWQWVAGCGADAAPYFRVFNPVLQAERFDPDFAYLRTWVPEIAKLPDQWIARPWDAPTTALSQAGLELGRDYPRPIVDLGLSRIAALEAYAQLKHMNRS